MTGKIVVNPRVRKCRIIPSLTVMKNEIDIINIHDGLLFCSFIKIILFKTSIDVLFQNPPEKDHNVSIGSDFRSLDWVHPNVFAIPMAL